MPGRSGLPATPDRPGLVLLYWRLLYISINFVKALIWCVYGDIRDLLGNYETTFTFFVGSIGIIGSYVTSLGLVCMIASIKVSCLDLIYFFLFLEDLYRLSSISLNSLIFTIRRQLVERKPEHTILLTQGIFILPHHINMVEQLAFDDAVSYTQRWKSKLAEVMAWGIELPIFRLGVWHPTHSAIEDATYIAHIYIYIYIY